MARKSYVYRILARLAYLQATRLPYRDDASAAELYSWLENTIQREEHGQFYKPESAEKLKVTLRELEGIGVVQGSIDPDSDHSKGEKDSCRWQFAGSLPADREILRRDGGSGDEPPIPQKPDGDGGGGPGGLAQILAHPVLFALDEEDLDAALAHAFGLNPDEGAG